MSKNKIAEVVLYKKLPRGMNFFDYLIPDELVNDIEVGKFVYVPLKNKDVFGVVVGLKEESEFKRLKPISRIDLVMKELVPYQVELIKWFSQYYFYSMSSALQMLAPQPLKRKVSLSKDSVENNAKPPEHIGLKFEKVVEQVMCSKTEKCFVLHSDNVQDSQNFYLSLLEKNKSQKKQTLILFPQLSSLNNFSECLPTEYKDDFVKVTSALFTSKSRYLDAWKRIQNNEVSLIVGTRSAVFAPLSKPGAIIVDQAHSDDYKQWDQNPRYDSIKVAQFIQKQTGCQLFVETETPRVEHAADFKENKYKWISIKEKVKRIKIIDTKTQRKNEFTYLGYELMEAVKNNLENKQRTLLIVNRKGEYNYFFCQECGYEANCPTCKLPLTVNDQNLNCHRCGFSEVILRNCPKCKSSKLRKLGIGIDNIKNQLLEQLNVSVKEIGEPGFEKSGIILSTGQNLELKSINNITLLGYVYVDSLAYVPDFNATFQLYSYVNDIMKKVQTINKDLNIILQTAFPEHLAFVSLNKEYSHFYKYEIEQRKSLNYPPFSKLIKLFYEHHDASVVKREANGLYELLRPICESQGIDITPPYQYYAQKVRSRYRWQMALFLPTNKDDGLTELSKEIPEYWHVDRDPINLL
jgi:primosomal protein N' (replication factor Y) (superfamily II helicase)